MVCLFYSSVFFVFTVKLTLSFLCRCCYLPYVICRVLFMVCFLYFFYVLLVILTLFLFI